MPDLGVSPASFATFGELLKFLRRRAQLSQLELSIAVGYSEAQISRLETNQRRPDRASVLALFVPALGIQRDPAVIERLVALCAEPAGAVKEEHPRGRLPAALTSFIGRREEIAEICQMLRRNETRLVTLTGAGGCGKTRLALAVAEALASNYPHGVGLAELAPLSDPHLAVKTVAAAFGLGENSDRPLLGTLTDHLRPRRALLILDNCEHLIETAAELTATLLRGCPQLHILATSRETLSIPGEMDYRVQPLALPPLRQGERPLRAMVEGYDAISLFVERAATARRGFALLDQNAPAIARICRRLDGIPLALELAAAWVALLTPEQIAERLDEDFALLAGAQRGVVPRHQTLTAAIEWSYNLLTDTERALLRRLSIFNSGWNLEGAESVAGGLPPLATIETLALLQRLVSKSLVVVEHPPEGEPRYRLLETIRAYTREKLAASGEEAEVRDRCLNYLVALAERADPELRSARQMTWLARLDLELDNLRAALDWSLTPENAGAALRLVAALGHYWEMRSDLVEGGRWCDAALAAASSRADLRDSERRAAALFVAGMLAGYSWDSEKSLRHLQESLRIYREHGDMAGIAATLCFIAIAQDRRHQSHQAVCTFQEAVQAAQQAEDAWWIAENLH